MDWETRESAGSNPALATTTQKQKEVEEWTHRIRKGETMYYQKHVKRPPKETILICKCGNQRISNIYLGQKRKRFDSCPKCQEVKNVMLKTG